MAGTSDLTVADICLAVTYSQLVALGHIDVSGHAKLNEWLAKVKAAIPNVEKVWNEGENAFAGFYKSKVAELAK